MELNAEYEIPNPKNRDALITVRVTMDFTDDKDYNEAQLNYLMKQVFEHGLNIGRLQTYRPSAQFSQEFVDTP